MKGEEELGKIYTRIESFKQVKAPSGPRFLIFMALPLIGLLMLGLLAFSKQASSQTAPSLLNLAVSNVRYQPEANADSAVLVVKTGSLSSITVDYDPVETIYGCDTTYTDSITSSDLTRHEVTLSGLNPDSTTSGTICYQVRDAGTNAVIEQSSFNTTRRPGEPFSFGAVVDVMPFEPSDVGPSSGWSLIAGQMSQEDLDLVMLGGDIVHNYWNETLPARVEAKYNDFFSASKQLSASVPIYAAAGNHEEIDIPVTRLGYEREFTLPENAWPGSPGYGEHYYSYDSGDTHFVYLSTEIPGEEGLIIGQQLQWLQQDLANSQKPWKVLMFHRPLFYPPEVAALMAPYERWFNPEDEVGSGNRAYLIDLFEQTGVDVVFAGHAHWYHHHVENGIHYVVTGGGGARIPPNPDEVMGPGDIYLYQGYEHVKVDEQADSMRLSMIDEYGGQRESFTISADGSYIGYIDSGDSPMVTDDLPTETLISNTTTITANFSDIGPSSGIDPVSARVELNGASLDGCVATESQVSCTVSDLPNDYHSITVWVSDRAGNTGMGTGYFVVDCQSGEPDLSITRVRTYWANYADYLARQLSVDYNMGNIGSQEAFTSQIIGTMNTNGVVLATPMPLNTGNIHPQQSQPFTLKYSIPVGVNTFSTVVYATANDGCGSVFEYPGPMPGI